MKKFLTVYLSLVFLLSSAFMVSAADTNIPSSSGSASFDVGGKYVSGTNTDTYSVDIIWGSMTFEYHSADKVWDPSTHRFVESNAARWTPITEDANAITVTNHSSKPITASFSYTPSASYPNINATFDNNTLNLAAPAEGSAQNTAPTGTSKITLSGALSSTATQNVTFGSVTVTISSSSSSNANNSSGGTVDTSTPVGYLNLFDKNNSSYDINEQYNIYQQSSSIYKVEFQGTADAALGAEASMDTLICINQTYYYIYEAGTPFLFSPNSTVKLSTEKYPDFEESSYNKITAVEAGKSYIMTIDLTDPNNMTATLTEVS